MSLQKLYYDVKQPSSFSGKNKLKRVYKGKDNVQKWLNNQDVYSLHAPLRKNFNRRPTYANNVDHIWQADLVDMQSLKKFNKKYTFILTVVDIFSKYAWAIPTKNKTGTSMINAFKTIFKTKRKPQKLQTDKGTEYKNKKFQKFLKMNNIHFYTSENDDIKASLVERFNRTLKSKMFKFFSANNTKNYVNNLSDMIHSYNNSIHRTIKMTPTQASKIKDPDKIAQLYNQIYKKVDKLKFTKKKFHVGDLVRITKYKNIFEKGYLPNYTTEVFKIRKVYEGKPFLYSIEDSTGQLIKGRWYAEEMKIFNGKIFKNLIKKKKFNNRIKYLVNYDWHEPEWVNSTTYYKLKNTKTLHTI